MRGRVVRGGCGHQPTPPLIQLTAASGMRFITIDSVISSRQSSTAKCPESSRTSSASGRSRRQASPPSGVKKMSPCPHRMSVGGCLSRRNACQVV